MYRKSLFSVFQQCCLRWKHLEKETVHERHPSHTLGCSGEGSKSRTTTILSCPLLQPWTRLIRVKTHADMWFSSSTNSTGAVRCFKHLLPRQQSHKWPLHTAGSVNNPEFVCPEMRKTAFTQFTQMNRWRCLSVQFSSCQDWVFSFNLLCAEGSCSR